jgi:hypothetical protein
VLGTVEEIYWKIFKKYFILFEMILRGFDSVPTDIRLLKFDILLMFIHTQTAATELSLCCSYKETLQHFCKLNDLFKLSICSCTCSHSSCSLALTTEIINEIRYPK